MNGKSSGRGPRDALALIVLAFVILSTCYSFVTRLKCGPDEPAHFIYVRSIATQLALPPISHTITPSERSTSTHEGHQPPLYYATMALPYALLKWFHVQGDTIWQVLRLLNIPIGALWIFFVFALSREFFGEDGRALKATAFVALIPSSTYMAGVVNNENLITLLFTWSLVPILVYFKRGVLTPRSSAFLGLLMGLAILTKAQGLVLIPLLLIALLAVCRRRGYADCGQSLRSAGIALGVAVVISGWWFVSCWLVYGSAMPQSLHYPVLTGSVLALFFMPMQAARLIWLLTATLYGYFWTPFWLVWTRVSFSPYLWCIVTLTVLVMLGLMLRVRRNGDLDRPALMLLLAAPLITYAMWLRYVLMVDNKASLQGRLFLSVAAVAGIVWVLGIEGLLRGERARRVGFVIGLAAMLTANIAVIGCAFAYYRAGLG